MTKDLFINERKHANKSKSSRYGDTIKQFAVILHFYSPKAYKFVRKSLHLPCPATIRAWAAAIKCEPGFLTCVIEHLQNTLDEDDKDCFLLVDEMSIKKQVIWDKKNKKFAGTTDYGPILAEEQDSIAQNALVVIMASNIRQNSTLLFYVEHFSFLWTFCILHSSLHFVH